jgi:hypothetical protein
LIEILILVLILVVIYHNGDLFNELISTLLISLTIDDGLLRFIVSEFLVFIISSLLLSLLLSVLLCRDKDE